MTCCAVLLLVSAAVGIGQTSLLYLSREHGRTAQPLCMRTREACINPVNPVNLKPYTADVRIEPSMLSLSETVVWRMFRQPARGHRSGDPLRTKLYCFALRQAHVHITGVNHD